ncbi:GNAT family N-acetyltransferase [Paenibacillus sp. FSL R7-0312]|uniref:GNAT family N-acetyltransferase n=1 Tax=unclassified Paenibacillus TaxID=185978 RepID=UPI0040409B28
MLTTDGCGYIETVYVVPEARETGSSKMIMNYIFNYFSSNGLNTARLEVWELNTRAAGLYRSLGFINVEKQTMFPGITL